MYSIMYKGRVVAHRPRILMRGVKFVVRKAGRERVLQTKRKNVHAFCVGQWCGRRGAYGEIASARTFPVKISYNPYKAGHFVDHDGDPVTGADGVMLNEHGVTACYLDTP